MKPFRRRLFRAALIIIVSAALLMAAAGPILSRVVSNKIKARLEASNISIGSLSINLFTRSVTLRNVTWSDSSRKAHVDDIYAGGIGIFPYLKNKRVSIRKLSFEGGMVSLVIDTVKKNTIQPDSINLSGIDIDRLTIDGIDVSIANDTVTQYQGKVRVIVHYLFVKDLKNYRDPAAYAFRNIETFVHELKIHKPGSLYTFTIKDASFDKELKKLHIDSLKLEPLLNKTDFAKKVKSQETRLTIGVASIDAAGVNMGIHMDDTSFMVSSVTINAPHFHAYKNKKYPFNRKEKFPLPMESFQALRFGIEVDTLKIHDGKVTYEELPIDGFNTAHITFEGLEATMNSVNNRDYKNLAGVSTLEASAHVMKTGNVKATFKLPLDGNKKYTAEGTITNVPLRELNPLLKDLAFIEISSGRLNKMAFAFTYDDIVSIGRLHFDYQDLRILSLKKERIKNVNEFKTMLVNTAVKNAETLTGTINVKRNQKKAVFNLWTISLVDGIKDGMMPGKKIRENRAKGN